MDYKINEKMDTVTVEQNGRYLQVFGKIEDFDQYPKNRWGNPILPDFEEDEDFK